MENMKTHLIINADDYGRSAGISAGIRHAHLLGVVTSTTCMLNQPTVESDLRLALSECPALGLGVHLNLTSGHPLTGAAHLSALVDSTGNFPGLNDFLLRLPNLDLAQVEAEWRAQIETFAAICRKNPTHLDSHHHSSFLSPGLFRLMCRLATEYDCAIRLPIWQSSIASGIPDALMAEMGRYLPLVLQEYPRPHPDGFISTFYDAGVSLPEMLSIIEKLPGGTFEIMTHPGYVDAALDSAYSSPREKELTVLTDPRLRQELENRQVQLIHFGDL